MSAGEIAASEKTQGARSDYFAYFLDSFFLRKDVNLPGMQIAVYNGSFNPLHKGHEAIVRFLTAEAGFGRDRGRLLPRLRNPQERSSYGLIRFVILQTKSMCLSLGIIHENQTTSSSWLYRPFGLQGCGRVKYIFNKIL